MIIKLKDRAVLKICGESKNDILKFLQQITSNNLLSDECNLVYALFLSGSGKFLFDGFIFFDDECVYIDCLKVIKNELNSHIKKYKARLNIRIEETKYNVYADFNEAIDSSIIGGLIFDDPRNANLGKRVYLLEDIIGFNEDVNKYHLHRVENSTPEGCYEMSIDQSFPIYFKMHEINAISLTKGCYLGQEPTNRLYRTGVLRKEVVKFFLKEKSAHLQKGDKINDGVICSIFDGKFGFLIREKEDFNIDKL